MPVTYYTEEEYTVLRACADKAKKQVEALEELRPVWAHSISAQTTAIALSTLWAMLKVENQTQAVLALQALKEKANVK